MKGFRGEQTRVLSFIHLRGGVGKTTTAVAIAGMLAREQRKHILLIDLDSQTDAAVTLISEEKRAEMDKDGRTIAQRFEDRLTPRNAPEFDIEKAIARRVSTINDGIARLELPPSSIRLIDLQGRIPLIALSANFTANPLEILRSALQPVIDRNDYVIIDCSPKPRYRHRKRPSRRDGCHRGSARLGSRASTRALRRGRHAPAAPAAHQHHSPKSGRRARCRRRRRPPDLQREERRRADRSRRHRLPAVAARSAHSDDPCGDPRTGSRSSAPLDRTGSLRTRTCRCKNGVNGGGVS